MVITLKLKPNDLQNPPFCPFLRHLLTKLKTKKKAGAKYQERAVQICSQNSWVGTTTSSNSQEGFSDFWQTRDEIRSKKKKPYLAAVGDGCCNDVSGFPNRPPHPRQSLPWCWGDIGNFHVRGLYVDGMIGISPAHCQIANFSMRYEFIKFRTYYC